MHIGHNRTRQNHARINRFPCPPGHTSKPSTSAHLATTSESPTQSTPEKSALRPTERRIPANRFDAALYRAQGRSRPDAGTTSDNACRGTETAPGAFKPTDDILWPDTYKNPPDWRLRHPNHRGFSFLSQQMASNPIPVWSQGLFEYPTRVSNVSRQGRNSNPPFHAPPTSSPKLPTTPTAPRPGRPWLLP